MKKKNARFVIGARNIPEKILSADISIEMKSLILETRRLVLSKLGINSSNFVLNCICEYMGVNIEDLRSKKRTRQETNERQLIAFMIRSFTSLTVEDVGLLFDKDHATITHSEGKSLEYLSDKGYGDKELSKYFVDIVSYVRSKLSDLDDLNTSKEKVTIYEYLDAIEIIYEYKNQNKGL